MANRYVWNRYNTKTAYGWTSTSNSSSWRDTQKIQSYGKAYLIGFKNSPTIDNGTNRIRYSGDYHTVDLASSGTSSYTAQTPVSTYPYVIIFCPYNGYDVSNSGIDTNTGSHTAGTGGKQLIIQASYGWSGYVYESGEDSGYWIMTGDYSVGYFPSVFIGVSPTSYSHNGSTFYRNYISSTVVQGDTDYGPVANASSGAYPNNGSSGGSWYVYQGSDVIDPASVTIPASVQGGTSIDITVTSSTGKKYGGTVSYTYQYRLNGGAWQALSGPTTATTQQLTVPKGTASVQVQVRAQDNLGFTSSTWVASETVAVTNNQPPTAPGSIDVANVVSGQDATITLTAATDPDGSIASYIYQRSVDSGMWKQFAQANTLTQTDTVSNSWGTVQYRACAVDNEGAQGPFATSTLYTVTSGLLVIGGPNPSLGELDRQFNLALNINVTGVPSLADIDVQATLDGAGIYTGQVDSGGVATIPVDARLLYTGAHTIRVTISHDDYEPATAEYTFTVPTVSMPDGGRALAGQTPDGEPAFFYTTAQAVFCQGGTLADVLAALQGGSVAPLLEPVIKEAPPSGSFALSPGILYDFTQADATALTFTFEAPESGKAAAYHVMFKCGGTAATVSLPDGVKTPDGYVIEANRVYELSILQNMLAYQSWGAS